MSSKTRRHLKVRSSKKYCEEKFSCHGEKVEAEYECEECKSLQCLDCETKLHELAKFVFHDRKRLQPAPSYQLCQLSCEDRNYSDVRCENCALNYCHQCFERMHSSGKRKAHTKIQLTEALLQAQVNKGVGSPTSGGLSDQSIHSSGEFFDAIKPLSPLGSIGDDSLTFMSLQQDNASDGSSIAVIPESNFFTEQSSSIMSEKSDRSRTSLPDVAPELDKLDLSPATLTTGKSAPKTAPTKLMVNIDIDDEIYKDCKSFLLVDQQENVQILDEKDFIEKLGCEPNSLVKVVSIFGNTGDGKSHTLNHTFFGGREVFQTSATQASCTAGVWGAYDPVHNAIMLDTEGLLGVTANQNQRTRLLLKVLAVSDVVIYRTQADRLHNDMFQFLGDASKAYVKHFSTELKAASKRCKMDIPLSNLGPAVVIFHETKHTDTLGKGVGGEAAELLQRRCRELDISLDAFSALHYVGTKTTMPPTNFTSLLVSVKTNLRNINVRAPRKPSVVFSALKACYDRGQDMVVVPKTSESAQSSWVGMASYAWSGYVLECSNCGVIYRSRQFWFGNQDPEKSVVRTEIRHVWPGGNPVLGGTHNAARRLLDSLNYATDTIGSLSAKPAKVVGNWVTDQIAPAYWVPNSQISNCYACRVDFSESIKIHHCRSCGQGFCDECSSKKKPVPERGWGVEPVRVCDNCFLKQPNDVERKTSATETRARQYGEILGSAVASVATVIDYPIDMLRESARPVYWVPDQDIKDCNVCKAVFGPKLQIHHCRCCGQGVCDDCALARRAVPSRGWDHPVRVCNHCDKKSGSL